MQYKQFNNVSVEVWKNPESAAYLPIERVVALYFSACTVKIKANNDNEAMEIFEDNGIKWHYQ